jgi:hypothetical protein
LVFIILIGFHCVSMAQQRHYDKNMVSKNRCLEAIARSKANARRDWHYKKEFLQIAWDSRGNCVGLDQYEGIHILPSMSICMVESPPLAHTVNNGSACYAITPNSATLCELPMEICAGGIRTL